MKNKISIKIYFLLALLGMTPPHAWGATECRQNLITITDSVVEIIPVSSTNIGVINPQNGSVSSISAKFRLRTNSDDNDYDFVLEASTKVDSGEDIDAYFAEGKSGYLILSNSNHRPSKNSIASIKNASSISTNPNAIAYPVNIVNSGSGISSLLTSKGYGGSYYKIIKGEQQVCTISQSISGLPHANTFSTENDRPGSYEAVITMSAYRKP